MKMVKSLILGSAAGLLAMGGAQAADLPVKAKAVEYVKVCSLYGAGFWYIPGTDTCMKIGGYLRVDATFNGSIYDQPAWSGDLGQGNRYRDYFAARSRMALTVDTRTATEYGVVRTFAQGDFQFSTLGANTVNPNSVNGSLPVAGSNLLDTPGGGYVAVEFVFIQFAGFTFGKSASAFATPWHGYPGNNSSFLLGGHDTVTGVNNIQYTAQFGNGVSGTIGLDDPTVFHRTSVYNLAPSGILFGGVNGIGLSGNAYAGVHAPDIVGNIRIDQAWGLFQISGSAHEVNGSYNILNSTAAPAGAVGLPGAAPIAGSELSGHPDSKWGGAVMAALQIKNIPTGPGDDIKLDATYAIGHTKQVISTSSASPSFAMFGSSSAFGAYQSLGLGVTTDGVWTPGGDIQLTRAWGIRGAFNHNWDPYWSTSLFGSYAQVRYNGDAADLASAKGAYCAAFAASHPGQGLTYTCDPSYNVSQLGAVTRWTPVKNLTFSAEVMWFHLDTKFAGTSLFGPGAPKPVAVYEFKDQDTVSLNVRVQRNF
ncbi:porin [Bradyrhizobium cenepequi]|uniref:porin n=1 Tax=Bradyrhizobium cenepequi TaxID=2821403 RepID=UPI001CE28374|nr:porin [Bradyrhizobium cenepequi]MCA6112622.1 porin [Bradyrhizobium cenepequi]